MAYTSSKSTSRFENLALIFTNTTLLFILLAIGCYPTKRIQWELYHQTLWRKVHSLLSIGVLIALGFALHSLPRSAKLYYGCAIGFFALELTVGGCRRTVHDARIDVNNAKDQYYSIQVLRSNRSCKAGVFYYFRGKPFPALSLDGCHDLIILQSNELHDLEVDKAIRIEGPYGPSIGVMWWTAHWILRAFHLMTGSKSIQIVDRRPPQLITKRPICFVADDTSIARIFSLWLWLRKTSNDAELCFCNPGETEKKYYASLMQEHSGLNLEPSEQYRVLHIDESSTKARPYTKDSATWFEKPGASSPGLELRSHSSAASQIGPMERLKRGIEAHSTRKQIIAGRISSSILWLYLHDI